MAPNHWLHDREHFYKYMTADTAKLVLTNNTFRWSSPTLFNDPFDVQFDLHMEYDGEKSAERAMQTMLDKFSGRALITQGNIMDVLLMSLKARRPDIDETELRKQMLPMILKGMEGAEKRLPRTHEEFRALIADVKLLCLSEEKDNLLMWAHYGKSHTGVVLELRCVEELDSVWGAARPATYASNMPRLIDDDKIVGLISGDQILEIPDILYNSVYVKAADWSYEKEWRLFGGRNRSVLVEDLPFDETEITGVYFGCRIRNEDAEEIRTIVAKKYPHATLHVRKKSDRRFALEFS